jgi:hypothetical protein
LAGWFAAGPSVPADGLERLEVAVTPALSVVPRGRGLLGPADRAQALAELLASERRSVVVDAGVVGWPGPSGDEVGAVLAAAADVSLLVTRPCYLSLRRAVTTSLQPTGVVLVVEPGRALSRRDVVEVMGVPVVAEVLFEPAVARTVDAGLLVERLPRSLTRALGRAA